MIKPYVFNNVDWYATFGNEKGKILEEGILLRSKSPPPKMAFF
jgi:hypothetical protein